MHLTDGPLTVIAVFIAAACVLGCKREVTLHNYDKPAIQALEQHAPEYVLDNNGRVVELKLENKQLDDAAFEQLSTLTAMRSVSLYGSSVSDAGLAKLQAVGELQAIGLGGTPITDKGLLHLAKFPRLRWLWLSGNTNLTPEAIANLKQALPDLIVYQ